MKEPSTARIQHISQVWRQNNHQTPFVYSQIPIRTPAQLMPTPTIDFQTKFHNNQTVSNNYGTTSEEGHVNLTIGSGFGFTDYIYGFPDSRDIASRMSGSSHHSLFCTLNK